MLLCSRRFYRATLSSEKHHHLFHGLRLRTTWLHRHVDAAVFAAPARHALLEWSWNARIRMISQPTVPWRHTVEGAILSQKCEELLVEETYRYCVVGFGWL